MTAIIPSIHSEQQAVISASSEGDVTEGLLSRRRKAGDITQASDGERSVGGANVEKCDVFKSAVYSLKQASKCTEASHERVIISCLLLLSGRCLQLCLDFLVFFILLWLVLICCFLPVGKDGSFWDVTL